MGAKVAASVRAVPSKSFDFAVETSYVYARDELIHDVYAKGSTVALVGDPLDGWTLEGALRRPAGSYKEALEQFEAGRSHSEGERSLAGDSTNEHTLTAFIVTVWQFWPATTVGDETQVVRAQLRVVQSPGTERLAMDPGLLRIREGSSMNHSLLTYTASIQVGCLPDCWSCLLSTVAQQARYDGPWIFRNCNRLVAVPVWTRASQS